MSNAKGRITYKSSDTNIAKINDNGTVIPVTKGNVTITIQAAGSGLYGIATKKIKVVVYERPITVKKVKVTSTKSQRTINVSWGKMSSASGYIVRYSYKKIWPAVKTL